MIIYGAKEVVDETYAHFIFYFQDSTNSPRSAGDEHAQLDILRSGSKTDSSDASSSIAVDCHTGPSEVIVKGKNVRKVRAYDSESCNCLLYYLYIMPRTSFT